MTLVEMVSYFSYDSIKSNLTAHLGRLHFSLPLSNFATDIYLNIMLGSVWWSNKEIFSRD